MFQDGLLKDQTIIVTGGGTGLGKSMSRRFGELGANIVISGRRAEVLDETAQEFSEQGINVLTCPGDVRKIEDVELMTKQTIDKFGKIDVVINPKAKPLNAPISTTLIVFELTGNWQVGLVVMVTVSVATSFSGGLIDKSFFLSQLKRRKLNLISGSKYYLLRNQRVSELPLDRNYNLVNAEFSNEASFIENRCILFNASLETTLKKFDEQNAPYLFVITSVDCTNAGDVTGIVHHLDLLKVFNKALTKVSEEEHS